MFSAFFAQDTSLPYIYSKFSALRSDYAKLLDDVTAHYASEKVINEQIRNNPEEF
jgi:hypothetical protein